MALTAETSSFVPSHSSATGMCSPFHVPTIGNTGDSGDGPFGGSIGIGVHALHTPVCESPQQSQRPSLPSSDGTSRYPDTPLKIDRLIPTDLMGVLDHPSSPEEEHQPHHTTTGQTTGQGQYKGANDNVDSVPSTPGRTTDQLLGLQRHPINTPTETKEASQQTTRVEQTVQMLLSINHDLSEEAAKAATLLAGADINTAQHVIDSALGARSVCRHMLNEGCYRSDCQFSHDVNGHTCKFWMKGRCGKAETCRFRHGFSEKLVDAVPAQERSSGGRSLAAAVTTTQQQGTWGTSIATKENSAPKSVGLVADTSSKKNDFPELSTLSRPPTNRSPVTNSSGSVWGKSSPSSSFATVASKGYQGNGSFASPQRSPQWGPSLSMPRQQHKAGSIRIPQDLWNPHVNRNAAAFHIGDPIERYREVNKPITRTDVIDLHYQSTKTFSVVLETVLGDKLRVQDVWIVTGSGHHVGKLTHQKSGGALESAVHRWLDAAGHTYLKGRDRNGHGGAVLVKMR